MKPKTHFAFRIDAGTTLAGVDDFEVAEATYRAAVARWPAARIMLRHGAGWYSGHWAGLVSRHSAVLHHQIG